MNSLPIDVLSGITAFLEGEPLFKLWQCGDKVLHMRLAHGGVETVRHIAYYDAEKKSSIELPSFLRHFEHLRNLIISPVCAILLTTECGDQIPALAPQSLAKLASKLESIIVVGSCSTPLNLPHFPASVVFNAYEKLHTLSGIVNLQTEGLSAYSNRLRQISVSQWSMQDLASVSFPSLTRLHVRGKIVFKDDFGLQKQHFKLPPNLIDLWLPPMCSKTFTDVDLLNADYVMDWMVPEWPPHLEKLTIHGFWNGLWPIPNFASKLAQSLPSSLKSFRMFDITLLEGDELVFNLPRTLRSLELSYFLLENLSAIPPTLTRLIGLSTVLPNSTIDCLPNTLTDVQISAKGSLDGSELPPGVTKLSIWASQALVVEDLPDSITHLSLDSPSCLVLLKSFPQSLKQATLTLFILQPFELWLSDLPRDMHTLNLDSRLYDPASDWVTKIPPGLKHFTFVGVLNDSLLQNCPFTSLSTLSITAAYSPFYTVTSSCFCNLPRSIIALRISLSTLDPFQLSDLPPAIQVAHINNTAHGSLPLTIPLSIAPDLPRAMRFLYLEWHIQNISEFKPLVPHIMLQQMAVL